MSPTQWQPRPLPRRRTRHDALPEHVDYRDTGCDLYPSCLHCPLPRCRYEEPGGAGGMLRTSRDASIVLLARRGDSVDTIASAFGLSRRSVFRVLQRSRGGC
jgi:hypothetical protein